MELSYVEACRLPGFYYKLVVRLSQLWYCSRNQNYCYVMLYVLQLVCPGYAQLSPIYSMRLAEKSRAPEVFPPPVVPLVLCYEDQIKPTPCEGSHQCDRVESRARSLSDFCKWGLYRTMPLVGRFSLVSPVSPLLHSGAAPISHFILHSSALDLAVMSCPHLSTQPPNFAIFGEGNHTHAERQRERERETLRERERETLRETERDIERKREKWRSLNTANHADLRNFHGRRPEMSPVRNTTITNNIKLTTSPDLDPKKKYAQHVYLSCCLPEHTGRRGSKLWWGVSKTLGMQKARGLKMIVWLKYLFGYILLLIVSKGRKSTVEIDIETCQ
ncbi:hypothetical protein PR048_008324 [Dryococelus australis]|uniref:Uncharacterized protein n=1 Tax=Dryococelus australis TaxID=614101 RepID=A0ABQ9HWW0_9NEOP|nr:hypothetical protein PR048_008324 [Dryococelus australis]